jgi:rhamnosyl/mannosyltransferase
LKILHVYKDYAPILGGIENHIRMLAEAQAARGHTVTVLVTNPGGQPGREARNGVQVVRVPRQATLASMPISLGFAGALRRAPADVTHLHFPYPLGEISQFVAGRRPYVITYHSDVVRASQQLFLRLYRPLLHQILRGATQIAATSPRYVETSPFLNRIPGQCRVVPLGIDPRPFEGATPRWRRGPRGVILFVGRHRYYKGVDDLIRAMLPLDADLLIAGDGPQRAAWQALAGSLGVAQRVHFLGDIPEPHLPGVYACADIFALPANARAEAFGTVLLEAMAAGLPCVTTEVGTGTSWVVQHGHTGLVVAPNDAAALSEALTTLLSDAPLRAQMGRAGRERLRNHFTLDKMVNSIEAVYQQALA